MDIFLIGTIIAGLTAGSLTGFGLRNHFARKIEGLVLSGSRYHLAQNTSGAVELRSGVRTEVLTKKEALALGPALKQLSSDVRSDPFLALRLLSKKHKAVVEAKSFEDSFLEAAVQSQRNELTRLAEHQGLGVSAARLIHAAREDNDFATLRSVIERAEFGTELPDGLLQKLGLEEKRRELEPLVLWSSQAKAGAIQQKQVAGRKSLGEEIPSLPDHTMVTRVAGRGGDYERIVVEIFKDGERIAKDEIYTDHHRTGLESVVARRKSQLIQRVKSMSALGV